MGFEMRYLFDTNAVINFISGKGDFSFFRAEDKILVSFITSIELVVGSKNNTEEEVIAKFRKMSEQILIDDQIINKTIEIRKRYGLKVPDSIIAATSSVLETALVTSDKDLINKMTDSNLQIIDPA
jgi:predicted nucleic acid-binding protein